MSKLLKSYIIAFAILISAIEPVFACGDSYNSPDDPVKYITHFKKFYFVRHGETDYNKQHKISGSTEIPLNDEGKRQAQKTAELLKNQKIDIIVASPMIRTKQTAEIIAKTINVPIVYEKEIREVSWGSYEGKDANSSDAKEKFALWVKGEDMSITGAENKHDFQKRIACALDAILAKHDNVLIVSHGGVFGNLTDILGLGYIKTGNVVPYEFIPANGQKIKYKILNLEEEKQSS